MNEPEPSNGTTPPARNEPDLVGELLARMIAHGELALALRPSKAARLLDMGKSKFYEMINRNLVPVVLIGGQKRVPLAALLNLLGQQRLDVADEGVEGDGHGERG